MSHQYPHLSTQVDPFNGCQYLSATSVKIPNIFSSGTNDAGLSVASTELGDLGLEVWENSNPDLVILDHFHPPSLVSKNLAQLRYCLRLGLEHPSDI